MSISPNQFLYKIKRKRREQYIDNDPQLNRILLELGSEDVTFKRLRDDRELEVNPLIRLWKFLSIRNGWKRCFPIWLQLSRIP